MKASQIEVVVWLSCAFMLAVATGAAGQERMPMHLPASITVMGSGIVTAPPDTAELTTGVVTQAPSAAQALAVNSAAMEAMLKSLRSLGIAQKDIQTTNITVAPQHRQGKDDSQQPKIVGYEVTRIASSSEDNGNNAGRLLGGQGGGCACGGHDDIDLERNQFGRKSGEPLGLPLGISVFDHEVAALDVPEVTQSLKEGLWCLEITSRAGCQVAYSSDLGRLLRLGGERHDEETAGQSA
jgi:Protein of unknown function (DUF541)